MPDVSISIANFYSGNAGVSIGTSTFTDLSGKFVPDVVGSNLVSGSSSLLITRLLSATSVQLAGSLPSGTGLPWSISTLVSNGQNITLNETPSSGVILRMKATATESGHSLATKQVQLDFDYGVTPLPAPVLGSGSATSEFSLRYQPGNYRVSARATNFRYPLQQSKTVFFNLAVIAERNPVQKSSYVLVGPVLPSDTGYPDAEEWNLNLDTDDRVIESNVKMLITTAQGERIMNPDYGTSIRNVIFDMDASTIQNFLQEEISRALTANEPRAQLVGLTFDLDPRTRSATLNLQIRSLLSRQVMATSVSIKG